MGELAWDLCKVTESSFLAADMPLVAADSQWLEGSDTFRAAEHARAVGKALWEALSQEAFLRGKIAEAGDEPIGGRIEAIGLRALLDSLATSGRRWRVHLEVPGAEASLELDGDEVVSAETTGHHVCKGVDAVVVALAKTLGDLSRRASHR